MRGFASERNSSVNGITPVPGTGRHEVGEHVGPQDLAFVPVQPPAQCLELYTSRLLELVERHAVPDGPGPAPDELWSSAVLAAARRDLRAA